MRVVVGECHLPSVHHLDVQTFKHGSEYCVKLLGEPVAVEQAGLRIQYLEVGRADQYQSRRFSIQQPDHCSADVAQTPYVHLHWESAEMRPDANKDHCVRAPSQAVQLIRDIVHLSRGHGCEADRWSVAAVSQQYVVVAVHCHVRANILRAMKVEFLKLYNIVR